MSTKTIIGVLVALAVVLGLWWFVSMRPQVAPEGASDYQISESSSDEALDADLANIDKDLGTLSGDVAGIEESLNDTPVTQEQL